MAALRYSGPKPLIRVVCFGKHALYKLETVETEISNEI